MRVIGMEQKRILRMIIGSMIVASAALTYWHSRWWILFTLFIGLNLFQSGITRWCFLEKLLEK